MFYTAFIHKDADSDYGVSFPDFPGCVAVEASMAEALRSARAALALHVCGMRAQGEAIPAPRSLDAVLNDADLADWRAGATVATVPLIEDRGGARRVNVSLDPGLLEAIDAEAAARGLNRSAFLASAARKEIAGEQG